MFYGWMQNARLKIRKNKARDKIWASQFAAEIYAEVIQDAPTYIAIDSQGVYWSNSPSYLGFNHSENRIIFCDRGYKDLENILYCEVDALEDFFVMKSGGKYRKEASADDSDFPSSYLTCRPKRQHSLQSW